MAQYLTVARPYANALFAEAKASDVMLLAWERVLQVLAIAVTQKCFMQHMVDPRVPKAKRKTLLNDVLTDTIKADVTQLGDKLTHFIALLLEYHRLQAIPDVLTLYQALVAKHQNTLSVQVLSAYTVEKQQQQQLATALAKHFNSKVNLEFKTDIRLIGGVIIRTDKYVMDNSIKGKLTRLHHSLNR